MLRTLVSSNVLPHQLRKLILPDLLPVAQASPLREVLSGYLEHDACRLVEVHHLADDWLEKVLVTWERAKGGQPGTPREWGDREQKEKGG